jgi:hypothetical protein
MSRLIAAVFAVMTNVGCVRDSKKVNPSIFCSKNVIAITNLHV